MESLRWIAVIFSMILGLGVTRLLSGIVIVFKARRQVPIDWLPLVWAGCVFLTQLQFWWGLYDIPVLEGGWNFSEFLVIVFLPMTLFLVSALLLPGTEKEATGTGGTGSYFDTEGRWALLPLSLYFVLTYICNVAFFRVPPISLMTALHAVLVIVPLIVTMIRSRPTQVVATLLYIPVSLAGIWLNSDTY